jgi:hypothetical protein
MPENNPILTKMVSISSPVPQVSKPAVPQPSKPARLQETRRIGNCGRRPNKLERGLQPACSGISWAKPGATRRSESSALPSKFFVLHPRDLIRGGRWFEIVSHKGWKLG